jgi:glycosyltransferase involved in cell wall biosynthesis
VRIAILSDTRIATNPNVPLHGLGQIVYSVACGLAERGHSIALFAAPGSVFPAGKLITATDERDFLRHDLGAFEAVIDNSHSHITGALPGLPAIQVSHDRESKPTVNAVFPSAAHRDYWRFTERNSRVIHNGVCIPNVKRAGYSGGYLAYMSTFYAPKQPIMAAQAAQLAGVKLHMAGPTPPPPPPGVSYVGPLAGADKFQFMANADALLFPASTECAPVTVLEAQSVGCPVIVSGFGGAAENMQPGITGYVVYDVEQMADAIGKIGTIDRAACIEWVRANRSVEQMVSGYEAALRAVASGEKW